MRKGIGNVGLKLVDAAIDLFEYESMSYDNPYIELHVVNPRLAEYLEYNRGFDVTHAGGGYSIATRVAT